MKTRRRWPILLGLTALLLPPLWAEQVQVLKDKTGTCQYTVPSDWKPVPAGSSQVIDPSRQATAALHATEVKSWAAHTSRIRQVFKPSRVFENSERRIFFQYSSDQPGVHLYSATPARNYACDAKLDILSPKPVRNLERVAKRIMQSVGAAR